MDRIKHLITMGLALILWMISVCLKLCGILNQPFVLIFVCGLAFAEILIGLVFYTCCISMKSLRKAFTLTGVSDVEALKICKTELTWNVVKLVIWIIGYYLVYI